LIDQLLRDGRLVADHEQAGGAEPCDLLLLRLGQRLAVDHEKGRVVEPGQHRAGPRAGHVVFVDDDQLGGERRPIRSAPPG